MKKLFFHPLFGLGLALRLVLIAVLAPAAALHWYVPFLDASLGSLTHFTLDPWTLWLGQGGDPAAFPYGWAMWLFFLPLFLLAKFLGLPSLWAYSGTLLLADGALLALLLRLNPKRQKTVLLVYWLSPVVVVASYGLGLNDVAPALILTGAIAALKHMRFKTAGFLCAAAVSAKLSMVLALPFFCIYLYHNRALRPWAWRYGQGLGLGLLFLGGPFLLSAAGVQMLFGNPELGKIYSLSWRLGEQLVIYGLPMVYLLMLYLTWRVKRLNFDLFQAAVGLSFLLIFFMTPASPGWFVWAMPFLVLYQCASGRLSMALIGGFSLLYVLNTLLAAGGLGWAGAPWLLQWGAWIPTFMLALGLVIMLRMARDAIARNDYFRLSRKPFVLGVAGDSGAGKDTYVNALCGLFGAHSVAHLSGDDYHLWDRQKPIWQVMTHLHPLANDLERFCQDVVALIDGQAISARHYDHQSGKMSRPRRMPSNDFIVASGLHALYLPLLRQCYDLKVYLDIDEGLRRHYKIQRDVEQRGHSLARVLQSFERREPDATCFVRPQAAQADLVFALQPIHPHMLQEPKDRHPLRLKLLVRTRNSFKELSIHRVLIGVCGLQVDMDMSADGSHVQLRIEGDCCAADIEMAAAMLCPRVLAFLDVRPIWQDGMLGLMQLITLAHIDQELTKRMIE